jgi:hypothetical protein
MGVPSLVSAIEASIPAFAFAISLTVMGLSHRIDAETKRKLPVKWGMVALMMTGVWLIGASID